MEKYLDRIPEEVDIRKSVFIFVQPWTLLPGLNSSYAPPNCEEADVRRIIELLLAGGIPIMYLMYDERMDREEYPEDTYFTQRIFESVKQQDCFHFFVMGKKKSRRQKEIRKKVKKGNITTTKGHGYKEVGLEIDKYIEENGIKYIFLCGGFVDASLSLFLKHFHSEIQLIGVEYLIRNTAITRTTKYMIERLEEYRKENTTSVFTGSKEELEGWIVVKT